MRKIYTVTLDDDNPLSIVNINSVKVIAYLFYIEMLKFDKQIVCSNLKNKDGLVQNELMEKTIKGKYEYTFTSEKEGNDDKCFLYEPFMIGNNTFGITVFPESITDIEIDMLLNNVLKLLGYNYKYNISFMYYDEDIVNARYNAINSLFKKNDVYRNVKVKTKIKLPIFGLLK